MKRIGEWLKRKRLKAGISQLDTANESYISVETLRSIENGSIYPRMNHFEKLCQLFGVEPLDYYQETKSPPEKTPCVSLKPDGSASKRPK